MQPCGMHMYCIIAQLLMRPYWTFATWACSTGQRSHVSHYFYSKTAGMKPDALLLLKCVCVLFTSVFEKNQPPTPRYN